MSGEVLLRADSIVKSFGERRVLSSASLRGVSGECRADRDLPPFPVLALNGAYSPRGVIAATCRGTCPPQVIGSQGAMGRSRRIGSVSQRYTTSGRRPSVTLRSATRHFARPTACVPETA